MKQLGKKYKIENTEYSYDIKNLRHLYRQFIRYDDEIFIEKIADVLHFACYVSWVKEIHSDELLSDKGLIHELVHLLKPATRPYSDIKEIRIKFEKLLVL